MRAPKIMMYCHVTAFVLITFSSVQTAAQTIWFVNADADGANNGTSWTDAFTSVQPGLSAANSGDQVWVAAGTYVERITLTDGVELYGGFAGNETELSQRDWTANETILDGDHTGSVVTAPAGSTQDTRIDGFIIRNGLSSQGGGICCQTSSSPMITNNTIAGNRTFSSGTRYGGGIYCGPSSSPMITNNTITGNIAYHHGGGIYCSGSSSSTIVNNTIIGNTAGGGGGIDLGLSSYATITSNTIMGNSATSGGGIYCSYSSPTITNNTIMANSASESGGGIYCYYSSPTIANNTIAGNSAMGSSVYTYSGGGGIYCSNSSPMIANNTITGNSSQYGGGGICCYDSSPMIANTIIAFNSSGIYSSDSSPVLKHNCVYGNTGYNYSGITDPTGTNGNISTDPRMAGASYRNVHIQPDSPCKDAGDNAYSYGDFDMDDQPRIQPGGGTVDIGADESDGTVWPEGPYVIVRVSTDGDDANDGASWSAAKRTVQAAIEAASATGGEVWVKAGTYLERITLHSYAYVYGGFNGTETQREERDWITHVTILDGQTLGSVVTAPAPGFRLSTIDGFTIRNGIGTLSGSSRHGGGIYCSQSSLIIANNTITDNNASYGGGIYCCYSSPMITNNTIRDNSGGGMYCFKSFPTIANNAISNNNAFSGGGIYSNCSDSLIVNNTISGNRASSTGGGGIYCQGGSPTIANNTITGNSSTGSGLYSGGGGIHCSSSATIDNNTITGNSAALDGGGIYCSSSTAIANTIIAFNSSGVYGSSGSPMLKHNCVYGNTDYDYSGITNPTGTEGNISLDPLFVDKDGGDYHLTVGSPCIDAGDNASVPAGITTDLDGNERIINCVVDMGAYEADFGLPSPIGPDFNGDCDVDGSDLETFESCASGPFIDHDGSETCQRADFDNDNDVDQSDFAVFQRCYSGEDNPANPNCDD